MRSPAPTFSRQTGGITILVALMLLVLLTIAAMGMSRNSFREVVTSGFSRQGAMARNVADSGLEWSIHWIDPANSRSAATGTQQSLASLKTALLVDDALAGQAWDITSTNPSVPTAYAPGTTEAGTLATTAAGTTLAYTLGLTRMGKLPIANMSQGAGAGAFTPASGGPLRQAPDLWAVRSDAQVTQGGVTFIHAKEAWISTPVQ